MSGRIGIVGRRRAGTACATRAVETGHRVTVWNRTLDRTTVARDAGPRVARDLAEFAGATDVTITSLPDPFSGAAQAERLGGVGDASLARFAARR